MVHTRRNQTILEMVLLTLLINNFLYYTRKERLFLKLSLSLYEMLTVLLLSPINQYSEAWFLLRSPLSMVEPLRKI